MLVAIIGTEYAGRKTLQQFLVDERGFAVLTLDRKGMDLEEVKGLSAGRENNSLEDSNYVPTLQATSPLRFKDHVQMLNFVTRNWRMDYVTTELQDYGSLEPFAKRPFCLVIHIDAPIILRFNRCRQTEVSITLESFVARHDCCVYSFLNQSHSVAGGLKPVPSAFKLKQLSTISITNPFSCMDEFLSHLEELDLLNQDRLRPCWDSYFMMLASIAAQRSNCMKRRVGAILVRNKRILATGYNGTPRGLLNCNEGGCPRCNGAAVSGMALEECLCLHAEENALLEAGRERIGEGGILYCNTCPCLRCTVKIVQAGVKEVVYNLSYKVDDASAEVFRQAGVILRKYVPPPQQC